MKALLLSILLLFVNLIHCVAQETLGVIEIQKTISKGEQPGLSVTIPQSKMKEIISDWKKYLRHDNRSDYKEINGEYILSKTIIPEISADSIVVYTLFNAGNSSDNQVMVFVCGKDSVFFNGASNPDVSANIRTFLRTFAVNEYKKAVEEELSVEQKKLKILEDDLGDLEKKNDQSEKKIKSNEQENDKKQNEINTNLQLQETKSMEIFKQKLQVDSALNQPELKSLEEKKLKDLEKDKKNLEKDNESNHKDIEKNQNENKDLQKKIDLNNSDFIPAKKAEIKTQKEVIEKVETKLKGIR